MPFEPRHQKTICLVVDSYWPSIGGVERWTQSIAASLSHRSDVRIITHSPDAPVSPFSLKFVFGRPFKAYSDEAGNPVIPPKPSFAGRILMPLLLVWNVPLLRRLVPKPLFDFLYKFYNYAFAGNLMRLIAGADLIHCFSTGYLGACATEVCEKAKIPFICSPAVHFDKWGDSPLLLRSYSHAAAIMCLSASFKTEFLRRMPGAAVPIVVVPAPVFKPNHEMPPDFNVSPPFILFLGRRDKHKGLTLLLSAFNGLTQKTNLVVAGPGGPLATTPSNVIDAGIVDEPVKNWLLGHCALFCLPSADESFGIAYIEAMMHGKPIVALDVAPVNELVVNGHTGILVPPGREDLLAQAIEKLLSDPVKLRTFGENASHRFRELYEGNKVMAKIEAIYDDILTPKRYL
jgi:glycosyltransferase involved in cell wall biosynthesis